MKVIYSETGETWHPNQRIHGLALPSNIGDVWHDDELAGYGLERVTPPEMQPHVLSGVDVKEERDKRIEAPFSHNFGGIHGVKLIDAGGGSRIAIGEALMRASLAVSYHGKQAGDLRWDDPARDFTWITSDNTKVPLDAPQMIEMAEALTRRDSAIMLAAREMKDAGDIPADYKDDYHWP